VHEYITSGCVTNSDGLNQYLHSTIDKLVTLRYIEPDLERICVGKASVFISGKKWKPSKLIAQSEMEEFAKREYLKPVFNFKRIRNDKDISSYEYLCERNALRVALQGYGIKSPLLWMTAGLFVNDVDFMNTGEFTTNFYRSILDLTTIPILGDKTRGLDWDTIDSHLSKGLPVSVHVDIYHMPYERNIYFRNRHGAHVITLLERRDNGYFALDWAHPSYFYGEVTTEKLSTARTSTNEKDQMSVFNGYPISATYQLLHLNRFPLKLDLQKYIIANLYKSARYLTDDNGILSIFTHACETIPEWVKIPGHEGYSKAVESLFFLDLELKFLLLYYDELLKSGLCERLNPTMLIEKIVDTRTAMELLKNRLLLALRRNKALEEEVWSDLLNKTKEYLADYCGIVLKLLKTVKSAEV
jgi:hypothetical protein